jgi:ribosome-binding factor A
MVIYMETLRQKKFARAIQKEMSDILNRVDGLDGAMITVGYAKTTADLQIVRLYISCFPEAKTNATLVLLNESKSQIRHLLSGRIKNIVRAIPQLEFYVDDTLQVANRIDQLLEEARNSESFHKEINLADYPKLDS